MGMYETETGLEFGEYGELGEFGETGELGEFGEATEFGEFGELGEFGETGEFLGGEMESPLSEAQATELASELLEISSEEELEQFLGGLFKRVAKGVGGFIKSPIGRALGGALKSVAKKALPMVGGALGSMVAPGVGTMIGSKLGSLASGLFEIELEAMPQEQAEFEVARRFVNLAAASARNAALARPRPGVAPQTVARVAVARAARTWAPGVYRRLRPGLGAARGRPFAGGPVLPPAPQPAYDQYPPEPGGASSGQWVRRGRKIIVLGA